MNNDLFRKNIKVLTPKEDLLVSEIKNAASELVGLIESISYEYGDDYIEESGMGAYQDEAIKHLEIAVMFAVKGVTV